jgi:hypothetical protein
MVIKNNFIITVLELNPLSAISFLPLLFPLQKKDVRQSGLGVQSSIHRIFLQIPTAGFVRKKSIFSLKKIDK